MVSAQGWEDLDVNDLIEMSWTHVSLVVNTSWLAHNDRQRGHELDKIPIKDVSNRVIFATAYCQDLLKPNHIIKCITKVNFQSDTYFFFKCGAR